MKNVPQTMRRIEARWWPVGKPRRPKGCWFGLRGVPHVHEFGDPVVTKCGFVGPRRKALA